MHLHWEADDLETSVGQYFQIMQLFDVAVADFTPGAMAFPDQVW
jgi:hypothetical protein